MKIDWDKGCNLLTETVFLALATVCILSFWDMNRHLGSISTELHRIADQLTK